VSRLPSDSSPSPTLQLRLRSPGSGAARTPQSESGISPARGRESSPGTLRPTATSRTPLGTIFPWPAARGFCMPCPHSRPRRRSARPQPPNAVQFRPLGLRPRGLGGALWRLITATSQAKLVWHYCGCTWGSTQTCSLFQPSARQLEIHVHCTVLYCSYLCSDVTTYAWLQP
jgi:hypothetical protein